MRKITVPQIFIFSVLATCAIGLGYALSGFTLSWFNLGEFYAPLFLLAWYVFTIFSCIAVLRCWLIVRPFGEGPIEPDSQEEIGYQVYLLFFLIFLNIWTQTPLLPTPFRRTLYIALGAKMGKDSYPGGFVLDPMFFQIGQRGLIGAYALVIPHSIEGQALEHKCVQMGDDVTIGACAVVHSGVVIGSNVIVASNAVVSKNTVIGDNEVWGGIPAVKIGDLPPKT